VPLLGAREGDRCALAVISLALDKGDAAAVLAVAGVAMSVPARAMLRVRRFRGDGPGKATVQVSPVPTNQACTPSPKHAPA
jgi:hypothetical protein